jgi:hypothetical protein
MFKIVKYGKKIISSKLDERNESIDDWIAFFVFAIPTALVCYMFGKMFVDFIHMLVEIMS